MSDFLPALTDLLNEYSQEEHVSTSDYIVACYLLECLEKFNLNKKTYSDRIPSTYTFEYD